MHFLYWKLLSLLEGQVFKSQGFGSTPRKDKETYLRLSDAAASRVFPEMDLLEKDFGHSISADWLNNLALHTQVVVKDSRLNWQHGRVLYSTLRSYLDRRVETSKPVTVFETGTARGFSAIVMARALIDSQAAGHVVTIDSLPHHTKMFWNCIDDFEGKKSRQELLAPWPEELERTLFFQGMTPHHLSRLGIGRIEFAFLDAQHTHAAVLAEFLWVAERQKPGDLIVFDDVTPKKFDGVVEAVKEISDLGQYEITYCGNPDERGYAVGRRSHV